MADPKYPEYNGVLRFDDDNLVEVGLQPDTENITVKLNGTEISGGGADLPDVTAADNGKVLTVVEGDWAAAAPAGDMYVYMSMDDQTGDVLFDKTGAEVLSYFTTQHRPPKLFYISDDEYGLTTVEYLVQRADYYEDTLEMIIAPVTSITSWDEGDSYHILGNKAILTVTSSGIAYEGETIGSMYDVTIGQS